jgi:hypothetical protein
MFRWCDLEDPIHENEGRMLDCHPGSVGASLSPALTVKTGTKCPGQLTECWVSGPLTTSSEIVKTWSTRPVGYV